MKTPTDKRIWVTWSGGIDSTALVGKLLVAGFDVFPIAMLMGSKMFRKNERRARIKIAEHFRSAFSHRFHTTRVVNGDFFLPFSSDGGKEVLRRNKHIMDYVMMNHVIPDEVYYIGMGSHLGADTPAVDHLHGNDTDSRHMISYLLTEYGIGYQLMSLLDFGSSRYKTDRIRMMLDVLPDEVAFQAYNCLAALEPGKHCGQCYKCVERHAAFNLLDMWDGTKYVYDPQAMPFFPKYIEHLQGLPAGLSWEEIRIGDQGSHREADSG